MRSDQPIKIAILAMGGEGGGVLADWIVDLGEHNGYIGQTTSVPGVAQRTGATIYYVELFPRAEAEARGLQPVLALMPLPGDVDVVLASELMEAGRAVQRGLVTPDRTTLIASTHRVYAIGEKMALGDGRVDDAGLLAHGEASAVRFIRFDMAQAAEQAGSVISAVLFGALAGAGLLPFSRPQFEATIERGGVGVKPSLRAFAAGFDHATVKPQTAAKATPAAPAFSLPSVADPAIARLLQRLAAELPEAAHPLALEGLRRLVDYQDAAYAGLYLDRLAALHRTPATPELVAEAARHLALWMSYEDTIRVADLKTRGSRFERVRGEVRASDAQLLQISEYMHPGLQEIAETMPAGLGRWLLGSGLPKRLVERFTGQGRVVDTTSLRGFLMLYGLASLRRWRLGTLRYAQENTLIEAWLRRVQVAARTDGALALELVRCQRLVKGYSDTHARGRRNFETLMQAVDRAGATLAPATLRELRDAALADEHGQQLRTLLARHALAPEASA